MILSNYRWNLFWIRQTVKLAMYRSSLEFAIRVMNLFFYFSVQRFVSIEFVICAINFMLVFLCYRVWQQIYRKNVALYWLSTRRLSDTDYATVQTVMIKP